MTQDKNNQTSMNNSTTKSLTSEQQVGQNGLHKRLKSQSDLVEERLCQNGHNLMDAFLWEIKTFYDAQPKWVRVDNECVKCYLFEHNGKFIYAFMSPFQANRFFWELSRRGYDPNPANLGTTYSFDGYMVTLTADKHRQMLRDNEERSNRLWAQMEMERAVENAKKERKRQRQEKMRLFGEKVKLFFGFKTK